MAKPSNRHIGNEAEDLACSFLANKGWEILERNFYFEHAEIDIIAKDQNVLVFLEVKMRSSLRYGRPEEFVTDIKVEKVFKAIEAWLYQHQIVDKPVRFDVIGIIKPKNEPPRITHLVDAFR